MSRFRRNEHGLRLGAEAGINPGITRFTTLRRRPALQVWVRGQANPAPVSFVGDITLMEAWTSINPDRQFPRQALEISQETRISRLERDGHLSVTCHPMKVTWLGGSIAKLVDVERIKIVCHGVIFVDTLLSQKPGSIAEINGGVAFDLVSIA